MVVNVTRQSGKQASRQIDKAGAVQEWCGANDVGVGFLAQDEVEDKAGIYFYLLRILISG